MKIRKLKKDESLPMDLLLLADPSIAAVKKYVNRGQCFVAELDDAIVGEYVFFPKTSETVELANVAVSSSYQGKGIGKSLVQDAIKQAKLNGYKTIEVGTGNSSLDQLAFYQKCGFRITGVDTDFFVRNYAEEIYENGIQCRDMLHLIQYLE